LHLNIKIEFRKEMERMPNRDIHLRVGAVAGGGYALYMAHGQPSGHVLAETVGGIVGGIGGGLLPDRIDVPLSPRHRAAAHSVAITGIAGRYMYTQLPNLQAALRVQADHYAQIQSSMDSLLARFIYWFFEFACRFISGALAGFLGGYASHLFLDAVTPYSLPLIA
jgi:membrane-bound metal-dependent hydrolase YbcI (DUF457 family)